MDKEKEFPKRKPTRLKKFDYNTIGAYFITLCTENRRQILSRIVGVDVPGDPKSVDLLPYGIVADKYIKQMSKFYENISVDQYVIMPIIFIFCYSLVMTGHRGCRPLRNRLQRYCILSRHSKGFVTKNTAEIFGDAAFTITSSEIARIMRKSRNTSTKIQFVGITTNCTQKNNNVKLISVYFKPRQNPNVGA